MKRFEHYTRGWWAELELRRLQLPRVRIRRNGGAITLTVSLGDAVWLDVGIYRDWSWPE